MHAALESLASQVMQEALELSEPPQVLLRATTDPKHGDYQINGAMALAKRLKKNPREIAEVIANAIGAHEAIESAEVAGPGFVNLRLSPAWVGAQLSEALKSAHLGITQVDVADTIVVDFSSPNIAKQMHVGHLRSTIIGWSLVKLLRVVGHKVIGDNHLGDWGTQFGLLIVGTREWGDPEAMKKDAIGELERVYKLASKKAKEDDAFAQSARDELAKLQGGDPENRERWKGFVNATRATLDQVYARLGVEFDEWLGESAYDEMLEGVVAMLLEKGIAREDQGAVGVFLADVDASAIEGALPNAIPKKLKKQKTPFIVRKSDGAFLYSTTDIATVIHRKEKMGADRSIYVVGAPQALHFQQLFATARLMGIEMELEHVSFGQVLGDDGKILRTRDGSAVTLKSLLDEAEVQARKTVAEKREGGTLRVADADVEDAVKVIGIGAVKFADLKQNRNTDYKFDFAKMVAFSGDAGPYLQYQYARTRSIFREGGFDFETHAAQIQPEKPEERALAIELARFDDRVQLAVEKLEPHHVCQHLYAIASLFSKFYSECKVLGSAEQESRLSFTALTGKQLRLGLDLLGIEVIERM
ncbi:MAG: arginine--tRNA ligase [Myxococcota bacterium]